MIGVTARGPNHPVPITSFREFRRQFGALPAEPAGRGRERWASDPIDGGRWWQLGLAVKGFFDNGGQRVFIQRIGDGNRHELTVGDFVAGVRPLLDIDEVSLCLAPGMWAERIHAAVIEQCETRRRCFTILDPPNGLDLAAMREFRRRFNSGFAALYYPWLEVNDARSGRSVELAPSGHIAGIYARVDQMRGVHAVPAGEMIRGITATARSLTAADNEELSAEGINALRLFPNRSIRVWGARTLTTDDEWKYVNVRRLFIYLEHSLDNGTQWVVFEPNGEELWAAVRQMVSDFLFNLWRQGALQGSRADEAFFVKCDRTTMTQEDVDQGRLVCLIGVAAVKPAEFILLRINQWTADHCTSCGGTEAADGGAGEPRDHA
jgi:phage tail sheath protein FI